MKIKSLPKAEQPRERLGRYGPKKLRDYELVAILLRTGIKGHNVLELSKRILTTVKKAGIKNVAFEDILKIKGLGKVKAGQIISVIELTSRLHVEKPEIMSARDVWVLCADIRTYAKEHLVAFYLDTQGSLIEKRIISVGTLNSSLVHPREVFEPALELHAASIIVAHNHPSGKLEPSEEDREVTKRLVEAGNLLGVDLTDHVIVSKSGYLSFQQEKLL